jgi:hypothetical protein
VPTANTLVRWVNENAFASKLQARPCPTFGRPVHRRGCPLDYGPVLLLMPFGFHLAMDTLPSAKPTSPCGQRGITPAFGYGPPHLRARGTSTLLNSALLSAQFGQLWLPVVPSGLTSGENTSHAGAFKPDVSLLNGPTKVVHIKSLTAMTTGTPASLPRTWFRDAGSQHWLVQ